MPSECLERHHEVDLVGAETTLVLGHEETGHPQLGETVPQLQARLRLALAPLTGHAGGAGGREQVVEDLREAPLLVGQCEPHRPPLLLSLGSPSTRSATMLRWISFVPA